MFSQLWLRKTLNAVVCLDGNSRINSGVILMCGHKLGLTHGLWQQLLSVAVAYVRFAKNVFGSHELSLSFLLLLLPLPPAPRGVAGSAQLGLKVKYQPRALLQTDLEQHWGSVVGREFTWCQYILFCVGIKGEWGVNASLWVPRGQQWSGSL